MEQNKTCIVKERVFQRCISATDESDQRCFFFYYSVRVRLYFEVFRIRQDSQHIQISLKRYSLRRVVVSPERSFTLNESQTYPGCKINLNILQGE